MSEIKVKSAVYGALGGFNKSSQVKNVTSILQNLIDSQEGIAIVKINNDTMNGDPSYGNRKHFGAELIIDGVSHYFACGEGQTINFLDFENPDPHVIVDTF